MSSTIQTEQDTKTLSYNLNTVWFPTLPVNASLYGSRSISSVDTGKISGTDVTTTSYGGTLYLQLNRRRFGNNNNNNNYNNFGRPAVLPDIIISRTHSEVESSDSGPGIKETRDDTRASLTYRPYSFVNINADAADEQYENVLNRNSYELQTIRASSGIILGETADLKLNGIISDRRTDGFTGITRSQKDWAYGMNLNFREKNRFYHYYSYNYSETKTDLTDTKTHNVNGAASYRVTNEISTSAGLQYGLSEYLSDPDPKKSGGIGAESSIESVSGNAAASWGKHFTPKFMGPFALDTNYGFGLGFSTIKSQPGDVEGSGTYYTNNLGIGVNSWDFDKENVGLSYSYSDRRDDSPLHNVSSNQSYRFTASSSRIPRTGVRASAAYTSQESRYDLGGAYLLAPVTMEQQGRSFTYDLNIDHRVNQYLSMTASANRGRSTTTSYTLSTLSTSTTTEEERYSVNAMFNYPITRMLNYRANASESYTKTQVSRYVSYQANMNLDYRIRQIFIDMEYRWREDVPDNALRTIQQYYFVRISRPF